MTVCQNLGIHTFEIFVKPTVQPVSRQNRHKTYHSSPGRAGGQTVQHCADRQSSKTRVVLLRWWSMGFIGAGPGTMLSDIVLIDSRVKHVWSGPGCGRWFFIWAGPGAKLSDIVRVVTRVKLVWSCCGGGRWALFFQVQGNTNVGNGH